MNYRTENFRLKIVLTTIVFVMILLGAISAFDTLVENQVKAQQGIEQILKERGL